ncbi:MAG: SU10 major capsid protein [Candidatus Hodarchaeales archaeon]
MTFEIGTITEFDDATSIMDPEVITNAIAVPLASNQAVFWNLLAAPNEALSGKKFEIYGRNLTSLSGIVGDGIGGGWNNSDTTGLAMLVAATNVLTVGSVIKVEDEIVVVSSVNRAAFTIDVFARGAGSTSAASHVDTTAFEVIGSAANDSDLKNVESMAEETHKYLNYVQTVFETIDYTKMEADLNRKGLSDNQIALLKQEAINRVAVKLARMCLKGVKSNGSATVPYMTAGLYEQLLDTSSATRPVLEYDASSATFTETILKAALEDAFEKGNPDTILLSQKYKNIANGFNQSFINTDRQDRTAGYSVAQYEYEGKILSFVVDQDCEDTKIAILTIGQCKKSWLAVDLLRYEEEPALSSREHRDSLQGSVGIIVDGVGYDHLLITALA